MDSTEDTLSEGLRWLDAVDEGTDNVERMAGGVGDAFEVAKAAKTEEVVKHGALWEERCVADGLAGTGVIGTRLGELDDECVEEIGVEKPDGAQRGCSGGSDGSGCGGEGRVDELNGEAVGR